MTDDRILQVAYPYQAYPDSNEITLRGQAIVDFARALFEQQWISVADRLPDPDDEVIGKCSDAFYHGCMEVVGYRPWDENDECWAINGMFYPRSILTHWMPLPPAPPEILTHLPTVVDAAVDGAVGAVSNTADLTGMVEDGRTLADCIAKFTPPGTHSSAAAPTDEMTLSQKLRAAGFTRRPSGKTAGGLMRDYDDDESAAAPKESAS